MSTNPAFKEVELVEESHEEKFLVAPITYRISARGEKLFSFNLLRRFPTDTGEGKTPWFFRRHIKRILDFLPEVEKRLVVHEAQAIEEKRSR